jgi:hypothetical protein
VNFTSKDFVDWKSNPVTKAVFAHYKERIEAHTEILSYQAGENPAQDRFHAGYIQAFRDALNVELGEVPND